MISLHLTSPIQVLQVQVVMKMAGEMLRRNGVARYHRPAKVNGSLASSNWDCYSYTLPKKDPLSPGKRNIKVLKKSNPLSATEERKNLVYSSPKKRLECIRRGVFW